MKKSVLGIFMALIQYPKLADSNLFKLIKADSRFSFILDIKDTYILYPDSSASVILEKIENEKIKNVFGEALVSEIKLSQEDAQSMIEDCIKLISQSDTEREQILKEKYNMQELTSAEKRELQQIILKKDKMSQEEGALIKDLSSN
jgi:DNA primase|tara:strand:- start:305 stop:742 length:438 start_codon:yes stop_codon:yes gene_type:complete